MAQEGNPDLEEGAKYVRKMLEANYVNVRK